MSCLKETTCSSVIACLIRDGRFYADLDQYEIAARVGCSQVQVSRLLHRAIARMRVQLLPGGSTC